MVDVLTSPSAPQPPASAASPSTILDRKCCKIEAATCGLLSSQQKMVFIDDNPSLTVLPIGKHIEAGGFGQVYKMHITKEVLNLEPGDYALRLNRPKSDAMGILQYPTLRELAIWRSLDFPVTGICSIIFNREKVWSVMDAAEADFQSVIGDAKFIQPVKSTMRDGFPIEYVVHYPDSKRIKWAMQLILQLAQLHMMGYAHSDLKPGNILVFGPDRNLAQITDFGACSSPWIATGAAGTLLPPENKTHGNIISQAIYNCSTEWKQATDVFLLGVILAILFGCPYHMLEVLQILNVFDASAPEPEKEKIRRSNEEGLMYYLRMTAAPAARPYLGILLRSGENYLDKELRAFLETAKLDKGRTGSASEMLAASSTPPEFVQAITQMIHWNPTRRLKTMKSVLALVDKYNNDAYLHDDPDVARVLRERYEYWHQKTSAANPTSLSVEYERKGVGGPAAFLKMQQIFRDVSESELKKIPAQVLQNYATQCKMKKFMLQQNQQLFPICHYPVESYSSHFVFIERAVFLNMYFRLPWFEYNVTSKQITSLPPGMMHGTFNEAVLTICQLLDGVIQQKSKMPLMTELNWTVKKEEELFGAFRQVVEKLLEGVDMKINIPSPAMAAMEYLAPIFRDFQMVVRKNPTYETAWSIICQSICRKSICIVSTFLPLTLWNTGMIAAMVIINVLRDLRSYKNFPENLLRYMQSRANEESLLGAFQIRPTAGGNLEWDLNISNNFAGLIDEEAQVIPLQKICSELDTEFNADRAPLVPLNAPQLLGGPILV